MRPPTHTTERHSWPGTPHATPGGEIVLLPGQLYFGRHDGHVKTLLGSCVALTLWHPRTHVGGMCHYLLPTRSAVHPAARDGRYGDEALGMMMDAISKLGLRHREFLAQLYGGADTMPNQAGVKFNIGERNIEVAWHVIDQFGLQLMDVDVGDCVPRNVTMNMQDGSVQVRRGASRPLGGTLT